MEINNFITNLKKINLIFANNESLNSFFTFWNQTNKDTAKNNPMLLLKQLEYLKSGIPKSIDFDQEEIELLSSLKLDACFGNEGIKSITEAQEIIKSNSQNTIPTIDRLIELFVSARNIPTGIINILRNYEFLKVEPAVDKGIIEITFNGKMQISNITNAHDLIDKWFLILNGYAELFDISKDDFEIINISKSSSTKLKFLTSLEVATYILGITYYLIGITKDFSQQKIDLEHLKVTNIGTEETRKILINEAEEKLNTNGITSKYEDDRIAKLVEEKIIEFGDKKEKTASLTKCINTQYNFMISGGDVKFIFHEHRPNDTTEKFEIDKKDIKILKEKYDSIKVLNERNPTDSIDK